MPDQFEFGPAGILLVHSAKDSGAAGIKEEQEMFSGLPWQSYEIISTVT